MWVGDPEPTSDDSGSAAHPRAEETRNSFRSVPTLIVLGLILLGGLYFAKLLIFDRAALDREADGGAAVAAVEEADEPA